MAASFVRRTLARQIFRYSSFFKSGYDRYHHKMICVSPSVKTTLVGTSLAFLGFTVKKEELSAHDQVRAIVSKGIVEKDNHNIKGASEAFHEALTKSTDFFKEEKISKEEYMNHRVFIYDLIANMALDNGDLKVAEEVFKETMRLALTLGMSQTDNAMIEMSLKLAGIYLFTGRVDIGVQGLNYVIEEQEKKIKENLDGSGAKQKTQKDSKDIAEMDLAKLKEDEENTKVLLGKAYQNYGHYHLLKRDFKKAQEYMQKALDISKTVMGEANESTFVLMNDLSTCLVMLQEYEKAELLLIDGIQQSGKAKSLMQSAFLSNLGALYIRVSKYPEAKTACEKGLEVAERGKDEYLMRPCKNCLAKLAEIEKLNKNEGEDE